MEVQSRENGWQVSCAVQNIGQRDGEEVVQVYLGRPENVPEGVLTAPKVLIDFKRISVKSGETKKVTFMIEEYYTRYFDVKSREYRSFTGSREIMIGASCTDIRLRDLVKGA